MGPADDLIIGHCVESREIQKDLREVNHKPK